MSVRLLRWLVGYVSFEFSKGFAEGFVNDCFTAGVNVHDLQRRDDRLCGKCSARTYPSLRPIARKNGGVVRITKKYGILLRFIRLRGRWGLAVGALCFVVIVSFLSGFVWNIDIVGESRIPASDISMILEENGVSVGAYARNIDRDMVENMIMAVFDDCAWAHINIDGTTATVEIDESVPKPDVAEDKTITNVKAVKDGIIVKVTTYDGWQVVQVGDSVVAGDLLISGVYSGEQSKRNLFTHANGEVIARVVEPFEMTISRTQCRKKYVDNRVFRSLYFFGLRIPLYVGSSQLPNGDADTDSEYIVLNGRELPVGIITKTVRVFEVENIVLDDRDLNALATDEVNKRITHEYGTTRIIGKNIDIVLGADSARAVGKIECVEQIGREEKIAINTKKQKSNAK